MTDSQVEQFFAALRQAQPQPRTELEYTSVYELLVAVMLSAQATDIGVNKATRGLFARAATPQAMVALGLEQVTQSIRSIGLFRTKAANVIRTSERLLSDHGGRVPRTREALEALPGVGRKTANVVLNVAFGEPTLAVDTHVFRVANRTGMAPGKTPRDVELGLLQRVPPAYRVDAHHWLILHGRYVCKSQKPACDACKVRFACDHGRNGPRDAGT